MKPAEAESPEQTNILLVDDRPANLIALESILEPLGQRLWKASSGEEALKLLLHHDFSVILLDVQMPGIDGFQTAALIKQSDRCCHIPILFLTAAATDQTQVLEGYEQGGVDFMVKPFDPKVLRQKVVVFVDLYLRSERQKREGQRMRQREVAALEERSDLRFRNLVDVMPHCVWASRPDGQVFYWNKVWLAYSGIPPVGSSCQKWLETLHLDDRERVGREWEASLRSGAEHETEYRARRSDGVYRWHLGRAVPERNELGEVIDWIFTATDIEDQKNAQVREERAREQAEAANLRKDEFLATLSHELRTPLTAILGWARMLRERPMDPARTAAAIASIERNAQAQTALIEDLLDVSRIITGKRKLSLVPVDLPSLVLAAADTMRPAAEAKGVQLEIEIDPAAHLISGDVDGLQQVCWNLLSNAVKFTPIGGRVQLNVRRVEASIEVSVSDSGQGISPAFLSRVFDRFSQEEAGSTRGHGGLGIGLAIVRHIVELHGGTVRAESEGEGKGATFIVSLPVRAIDVDGAGHLAEMSVTAAQRLPPASLAQAPSLAGLKVLVVDDDTDSRELLAAVLEECGAAILTAGSAEEGFQSVKRERPDVLLSDIAMPGEDGYSLVKRVRALADEDGGSTQAIALTGFARLEDARRALAAGFQRHVSKPVDPGELVALVAQLGAAAPIRDSGKSDSH